MDHKWNIIIGLLNIPELKPNFPSPRENKRINTKLKIIQEKT
jgi:hypothetical protein